MYFVNYIRTDVTISPGLFLQTATTIHTSTVINKQDALFILLEIFNVWGHWQKGGGEFLELTPIQRKPFWKKRWSWYSNVVVCVVRGGWGVGPQSHCWDGLLLESYKLFFKLQTVIFQGQLNQVDHSAV